MAGRIKDLSGEKFGMLTVIKQFDSNPVRWLCKCDCGTVKPVIAGNLKNGSTVSCGCYRKLWRNVEIMNKVEKGELEINQAEISPAVGVAVGIFNFIASSEGIVDRRLFVEKGEVLIAEE